jgi:histidinol-phosphate/aromatic aminotransferase/cobyric acid decarboxylase-like protein
MTNHLSSSSIQYTHGGDRQAFTRRHSIEPDAVLDFSVYTWPFGVPKKLVEVLVRHWGEITCYPDIHAESLRQTIARCHDISPEFVIPANGSMQLIYALCSSSLYSDVLIFEPTFNEYRRAGALHDNAANGREPLNTRYFNRCPNNFRYPR